jgi:hypothetical protein
MHERQQATRQFQATQEAQEQGLLVRLGLDDLAATVKTVWTDVMTQMRLTRGGLDGQRRRTQMLVRTVHTALGR